MIVHLFDPGPDGLVGSDDDILLETVTSNASGAYAFTDKVAGSYDVAVDLPTGYDFTQQNQGGDDTADSDASLATGRSGLFILTGGVTDNNLDIGLANSQLDYGDLLSSYDNTNLGENGARHLLGSLRMGAGVGPDPEGQRVHRLAGYL